MNSDIINNRQTLAVFNQLKQNGQNPQLGVYRGRELMIINYEARGICEKIQSFFEQIKIAFLKAISYLEINETQIDNLKKNASFINAPHMLPSKPNKSATPAHHSNVEGFEINPKYSIATPIIQNKPLEVKIIRNHHPNSPIVPTQAVKESQKTISAISNWIILEGIKYSSNSGNSLWNKAAVEALKNKIPGKIQESLPDDPIQGSAGIILISQSARLDHTDLLTKKTFEKLQRVTGKEPLIMVVSNYPTFNREVYCRTFDINIKHLVITKINEKDDITGMGGATSFSIENVEDAVREIQKAFS